MQDHAIASPTSDEPASRPIGEGDEIAPGLRALSKLGESNTHEVFVAWDDARYTVVAAKLLLPDLVDHDGARRDLGNEAALLRALDHPVLPRCFGSDLSADRPYVTLEYVDGPRLSTVIRRQRRLGVEQAVPLLQQVTGALHYLHGKGLVHLDVKPKNVIMSPPPRLIDLSVARRVEDARQTRNPVGTDPYMAPEQTGVGLEHLMGPTTDVWGLGVTLYESLAGIRPFPRGDHEASGADRFPQLRLDPAPLPRDVPPRLAALISATLERRPHDRPTAAEVADELDPVIGDAPRKLLLGRFRVTTWRPTPT
ncbi:MAG TPA: serine/threonine-protein kinase [Actinomycetota bacterium]|nr:serine/threonine-protein kinase [Actinomycetota bacterium]